MELTPAFAVYQPRKPKQTPLWKILVDYFDQFEAHLQANILYPLPHRQYVFSMSKILRGFFKYNRQRLGKHLSMRATKPCHLFPVSFAKACGIGRVHNGHADLWRLLLLAPHIHAIVSDGLYTETGYFYVMAKQFDLTSLNEIFRANILAMLKKEGRIDDDFIRMIIKWRHTSGFSVHNQVRLARDDKKGQEALAQYIIRNPFSLKKVHYPAHSGTVFSVGALLRLVLQPDARRPEEA